MAGLDDELRDWFKNVVSASKLSLAEQAQITQAGAKVYQKKLESETRSKHYSNHEDKKAGHMADHITVKATNIDGQKDGTSVAAWNNAYHAANARRLNDGTKKYPADHFVENARAASMDEVLAAEAKEYDEILKKKGWS